MFWAVMVDKYTFCTLDPRGKFSLSREADKLKRYKSSRICDMLLHTSPQARYSKARYAFAFLVADEICKTAICAFGTFN